MGVSLPVISKLYVDCSVPLKVNGGQQPTAAPLRFAPLPLTMIHNACTHMHAPLGFLYGTMLDRSKLDLRCEVCIDAYVEVPIPPEVWGRQLPSSSAAARAATADTPKSLVALEDAPKSLVKLSEIYSTPEGAHNFAG